MVKNISIISNDKCTGCGACRNICPVNAIIMQHDSKGFLRPQISTKCVMCGKCIAVCSAIVKADEKDTVKKGYAVKNINEKDRYSSSSGGFFSVITNYVLNLQGSVYGAVFGENYQVQHSRAVTHADVCRMKGSKYVQSDTSDIYMLLENDLRSGKWVLFTGTPCQCAGVKKFLVHKQICIEKLILLDVICHGVPSPLVWKLYVQWQKAKYGTIDEIRFRDKRFGSEHYGLLVKHGNHEYCKKDMQDPYIHIFCKDLAVRDSCKDCIYKKKNRGTDITMGDFPDARKKLGSFCDSKGISFIMLNSHKGEQIYESVQGNLEIMQMNMKMYTQSNLAPVKIIVKNYQKFWDDLERRGFPYVLKKYTEEGLTKRLYGNLKRAIKKLIKKM